MTLLPYHYTSNSGAYLMHPSLSILREVFFYAARFLPSKYIIFFVHWTYFYLFFHFVQVYWTVKVTSPFTLPQASLCFTEGFITFSFMVVLLEHSFYFYWVHLTPEGFLCFSFIFGMPCASMNYPPVNTGAFHGFYLFCSIVHNAMGLCSSQTILQVQDILKVFLLFLHLVSPMPVMHQHWGAECSVYIGP